MSLSANSVNIDNYCKIEIYSYDNNIIKCYNNNMYVTSCLDLNNCPVENRRFDVICDFQIGYQHYICNMSNTCTRTDGKMDCCASNIADCIVNANSIPTPTIQPTLSYNDVLCNKNGCNNKDHTNKKCYWYESIKSELYCADGQGNNVCCSVNRQECCIVHLENVYIAFGCSIIFIFAIIGYVYCKKPKIAPDVVRSIDQEL